MSTTYPNYLTLIDYSWLLILVILGEKYKLWNFYLHISCSRCSFDGFESILMEISVNHSNAIDVRTPPSIAATCSNVMLICFRYFEIMYSWTHVAVWS
jgi:hypothetical protein